MNSDPGFWFTFSQAFRSQWKKTRLIDSYTVGITVGIFSTFLHLELSFWPWVCSVALLIALGEWVSERLRKKDAVDGQP